MDHENERLLRCLPWARRFAKTCSAKLPAHLDREDLQAAGMYGYLRAASRYKEGLGASFRGYCARRIQGAVLDELRRWDWAPRSVHKNHRSITRVTSDLAAYLERDPTRHEVAHALGLAEHELAALQVDSQLRQMISLDEVMENECGEDYLPLRDRLADPGAAQPDARVRSLEERRALLAGIGRLPKTQAIVIVLYYLDGVSLREVARLLSVTPSRVSQLHYRALGRLKQTLTFADSLG